MADQNLNGALDTAGKHRPPLEPLQIKENFSDIPQASSSPTTLLPNSNPYDEIIPHLDEVKHRNLILCFDGTGDQFDADNSNIVEFFSMLKRDDRSRQLVYYQAGIGTYTIPQIAKPWTAKFQKTMDMMIGIHLDAHIMGGYEFLMQNFQAGDKIFIFGFSRGAYTARALAGMIHKIGLLPPCNHQQVPFAYKMYTREDEEGWNQSNQFKKTFSIDVDIEFVGVWDTVGSVGLIPRRLPFTKSNSHIRYFRHAISLDECRARFKVNLWNRPSEEDQKKGVQKGTMPRHHTGPIHPGDTIKSAKSGKSGKSLNDLERQYTDYEKPTDIEEVWFAGAHCDIGGGSVANATRHNLARIPLRWMIRQCFILKTGILFHKNMFKSIGLDPDTLYPHVLSRPPVVHYTPGCLAHRFEPPINYAKDYGKTIKFEEPYINEEEEDMLDALTPIYDQLKMVKGWWILEVLPTRQHYQKADDTWTREIGINFGGPRIIPKQAVLGVKVHRSVKIRMEAEGFFKDKKYQPAAKFLEPTWVD